jgi:hypothetical protein
MVWSMVDGGGYLATTPPANDVAHARRGGQPSCLEVNIRGRGERGETRMSVAGGSRHSAPRTAALRARRFSVRINIDLSIEKMMIENRIRNVIEPASTRPSRVLERVPPRRVSSGARARAPRPARRPACTKSAGLRRTLRSTRKWTECSHMPCAGGLAPPCTRCLRRGVARSWLPYLEDGHWLGDVAVGRTSPIPRPNMGARPSS